MLVSRTGPGRLFGIGVLAALLPLALRAQTPAVAMTTPLPAAERLAAGDLIDISVFQAPELTTSARLDAAGAITMPEAGRVVLAGMTAPEAEAVLDRRLQADYLRAPQAHVLVREFAPQPVTVLGAVKNPGVYSARSFPTLAEMIAAAGGVVAPAGDRVLVTRGGGPPLTLNLDAIERGGEAAPVPVAGGDLVRVVPAATVYVGGDVVKPGAYPLPAAGLTLVEAISEAGGITRDGHSAQTRLVRTSANGMVSTQWLDARPILQGRAPDLPLEPFDLVYIPNSAGRAVGFNSLQTVLNVGTTILTGLVVFH